VGGEDCLTLNVWTPQSATATSKLPVLFFVHGGSNVFGSSAMQLGGAYLYEGAALASTTGSVVVTINYRLGALGFLALNELAAEDGHHTTGDYGLLDQIAALQWVKTNIAGFGGDPTRVLLFGESAGGIDTCALIASPLASGLFSAALIESASCIGSTLADATAYGTQVESSAGCTGSADVLSCLRALPPEKLVAAGTPSENILSGDIGRYNGVVDGYTLTALPIQVVKSGAHNHVPLVIGTNADETSLFVPLQPMTEDQYHAAVLQLARGSQAAANTVLSVYPSSDYASPRAAYVALTTDVIFTCQARTDARAFTAAQSEPVFRYYFTHPFSNGGAALKAFGVSHGMELLYVFRQLEESGFMPSAAELSLSDAFDAYWSHFAATGDPNGNGPAWPRYDPAADTYLQLDTTITTGAGLRTKYCDFWDAALAQMAADGGMP
jgi:para-nitrobenzyl esterase